MGVITDIKQNRSNKKFSVFVDDEFVFSITDVDVLYYKLSIGDAILQPKLDKIREEVVLTKAKEKAAKYVSYKSRTEKEVRTKLQEEAYTEDIIEEVMAVLLKYGYVDDEKYAQSYVKAKHNYGALRLRYELQQRGVSSQIISEALEGIERTPQMVALFYKKLQGDTTPDYAEKRKAFDYVARRGYDYDDVNDGYAAYLEAYADGFDETDE